MVLDRIENSEFILQNTLIAHSGSQIRIPVSREYYAVYEMMEDCYNRYNNFVFYGDNNEFLELVNENFNMKTEKWYLLPQAFSITLTRTHWLKKTIIPLLKSRDRFKNIFKNIYSFFAYQNAGERNITYSVKNN